MLSSVTTTISDSRREIARNRMLEAKGMLGVGVAGKEALSFRQNILGARAKTVYVCAYQSF